MAQIWYKKATVQAAMAGGAFVIVAAIITGFFTLYSSKQMRSPEIKDQTKQAPISQEQRSDQNPSDFKFQAHNLDKPSSPSAEMMTEVPESTSQRSRLVIEAASQNLLLNSSAEAGQEHWGSLGEASIETCGWRDKCFVVRNGGKFYQDVIIDRGAGGYALFFGKVSCDKIDRNGSITDLPYLYGYMMVTGQTDFIVDYLQGQNMLGRPRKKNSWVYAWGIFHLPYSVTKIRYFLGQGLRKDDPHDGSRAMFNGLGLYMFTTEKEAREFLREASVINPADEDNR